MNKIGILYVSASIGLSLILLLQVSESPANAADREWRFNEHGRNIDIDICVMCTQTGPQGPQGEPGPQGPPGPDKELQVRTVVGDSQEVQSGDFVAATAICDPDEVVTGGGATTSYVSGEGSNVVNPSITEVGAPLNPTDGWSGAPLDAPNGWWFLYENPGPEPVTIAALAECAKLIDVP